MTLAQCDAIFVLALAISLLTSIAKDGTLADDRPTVPHLRAVDPRFYLLPASDSVPSTVAQASTPWHRQRTKISALNPDQKPSVMDPPDCPDSWEEWLHLTKYAPLSKYRREIRLITCVPWYNMFDLDKTNAYEPPQYYMRRVPLDGSQEYIALSYVWGNPGDSDIFVVNGDEVWGPTNLQAALRHLTGELLTKNLWADSICINQEDAAERGHQVLLMGEIYKQAKFVVVWLGEQAESSKTALDIIDQWGKAYLNWLKSPSSTSIMPEQLNLVMSYALEYLLRRPWWKRIWTIQEIGLAKEAYVFCGSHKVRYVHMVAAVRAWHDAKFMSAVPWREPSNTTRAKHAGLIGIPRKNLQKMLNRHPHFIKKCNLFMTRRAGRQYPGLLDLVRQYGTFDATDARDKIYALMGLNNDIPGFEPNYKKSIICTYVDFAAAVLHSGDLSILQDAGLATQEPSCDAPLPSWVPDWRKEPRRLRNFDLKLYQASSTLKAEIVTSCNNFLLSVRAVICDSINDIQAFTWNLSQSRWLSMAFEKGLNHRKQEINTMHVLFRTLMADCDHLKGTRLSTDSADFQQFALAFIKTLGTVCAAEVAKIFNFAGIDWYSEPHFVMRLLRQICDLKEPDPERINFEPDSAQEEKFHRLSDRWSSRALFRTATGYIGLAPESAEPGDHVCILLGYQVPVILRKFGDKYIYIGDCFVLDLMDGEAVQELGDDVQLLDIM